MCDDAVGDDGLEDFGDVWSFHYSTRGVWDQITRAVDTIREIRRIAVDSVLDSGHFLASFLQSENLLGIAFAFPRWYK